MEKFLKDQSEKIKTSLGASDYQGFQLGVLEAFKYLASKKHGTFVTPGKSF